MDSLVFAEFRKSIVLFAKNSLDFLQIRDRKNMAMKRILHVVKQQVTPVRDSRVCAICSNA